MVCQLGTIAHLASDRNITAEELKQNLGEFIEVVKVSFDRAESSKSGLQLEEIELSIEISKLYVKLYVVGALTVIKCKLGTGRENWAALKSWSGHETSQAIDQLARK